MSHTGMTYQDFFGNQIAALGDAAQRRVRSACVAIAGPGGVGTSVALTLGTAGVGKASLVDGQVLTPDNANRLPHANLTTMGQPKANVLQRLLATRPYLSVQGIQTTVEHAIALNALTDADLIVSASNTRASRVAATRYAV